MNFTLFKRSCHFWLFTIALLFPVSTRAQIDPEPSPTPQPLPDRNLPPLEIPADPTPPLQEQPFPENFVVKEFNIIGSTVFTAAELNAIVAPYLDRPLSFAKLLESASQITQLYQQEGYITSGAFVPPQEIRDGLVTIQILEGSVQEINITGLNRLNSGYVRSRVAKGSQTPLNRDRLLLALQLLQLDPIIENITAELAAGATPGVSIINLDVTEADPFTLQLTLDNQRSPQVGSFRRKFAIEHLNFFGFGDRFTVGYVNTDGSNSLDNLSYTIPINASNGTISFRHSRTASDLVYLEAPFDIFDIETDTIDYDLTYRQPLDQTPNREFTVGATASLSFARSVGFLETEEPFPISNEANARGEVRISALRLFQEYVDRDRRQVFAALSEFNIGLDIFDSTINDNLADSRFLSWRGQGQYLRLLNSRPPYTSLLLRGSLQFANDLLLPREQFSLGGASSVRGYSQNALFGDNGLFLSAEVRQPILSVSEWDLDLQVAPFIDFGTVWNDANSEQPIRRDTISGVGIGLLLNIGTNFDARLDWGIPLDGFGPKRNLQENGLYFTIRYRPM